MSGSSMMRGDSGDGKEGREWRLPGLLYPDNLVICGKSEEKLKPIVGHFVHVRRRRGLKVNADKSKMRVLNREELFSERLVQMGCDWNMYQNLNTWDIFDESDTDEVVLQEGGKWEEDCRCYQVHS